MRWRQFYPGVRKASHLQPPVIVIQVHPFKIVGFLGICDLRWDASKNLAVESKDLHCRRTFERISRRVYYPGCNLSRLYAFIHVESKRYIYDRVGSPFGSLVCLTR